MQDGISDAPKQDSGALGVGRTLREAREGLGLSLDDVANRLKFAPNQIAALEQEDFSRLPEIAFVRGFVRSYARLLQLDETSLLEKLPNPRLQEANQKEEAPVEEPFPNVYALRKSNIMWLGAGLAVALVLGLFVWLFGGKGSESKLEMANVPLAEPASAVIETPASAVPVVENTPLAPKAEMVSPPVATGAAANTARRAVPQAASPVHAVRPANSASGVAAGPARRVAPAAAASSVRPAQPHTTEAEAQPGTRAAADGASPPAPATVAPAAGAATPASAVAENERKPAARATLRLVFEEDSWFEVKDQKGTILLSQLGLRGSERALNRAPPYSITIGHAHGVKVYFKGKEVDLGPYTRIDVAHLTLE